MNYFQGVHSKELTQNNSLPFSQPFIVATGLIRSHHYSYAQK